MNTSLKSLAYRMLGSVAEAEDVVQDAYLKLHLADPKPDSEEAFLYRVVSNLCIDRLRAARTRRKYYSGPWLPEPWLDDEPDVVEMAEQLSMGFMLLLEQLSPAQRVVYVLREGFGLKHGEIAAMLNISEAGVRQHAVRARARLQGHTPPTQVPDTLRGHLDKLLVALAQGDADVVAGLLAEDAVAFTDGGGVVSAAIRPIVGRQRIAQVALHLMQKNVADGPMSYDYISLNGSPGLVISQHGRVHSTLQIEVDKGLVSRVFVMRNPAKLRGLPVQ